MLYSIKDWSNYFENNRTKDLKKMGWVPIPNKQDGDGYTELLSFEDGPCLFGAWVAIVQIASKCEPRGVLIRDGNRPHTAESMARMSRMPAGLITRSLAILVDIGWLESAPYEIPHLPAVIPHLPAETPPVATPPTPHLPASSRARAEWNGMEWKGREGMEGNSPPSPQFAETPSWDEFWGYCQMGHGPGSEVYARDRYDAAAQKNWRDQPNWRAYATRCRSWWEEAGRPMTLARNNGNGNSDQRKAFPETKLKALQNEIDSHPANKESAHFKSSHTEAHKKDLRDLRKKLQEVNSQIARA